MNKFKRNLEHDSICSICGTAEENSFHATVACTKPKALREEMRKHWTLPKERDFIYSGPDWLHAILAKCASGERDKVLMLLWRSWFLRCDITHGKGEETILGSVNFLKRYVDILQDDVTKTDLPTPSALPSCDVTDNLLIASRNQETRKNIWQPPAPNELKVNVDASFIKENGCTAVGVLIRNHLGQVIVASSRVIEKCHDAEEAEASAILEGLKLAIEHSIVPTSLELDCSNAIRAAANKSGGLSRLWPLYSSIQNALALLPGCKLVKVDRVSNVAAHELAAHARRSGICKAWVMSIPEFVLDLACKDVVTVNSGNI